MGYLRRQLVIAGLTGIALRPVPGLRAGIASFFAGMTTGELAPHLIAFTALDTASALTRGRARPAGLLLAAGSTVGLGVLVKQAYGVGELVETSLVTGIGDDYSASLSTVPTKRELATQWRELARPFRMRRAEVERIGDVNYTEGGKRARLDIFRPRGAMLDGRSLDRAPVLVQVHGGAWVLGNKESQGQLLMNAMASRGWVCVALNYRLAPQHRWPAQVVDTKQVLAWVQDNIAAYGGDPSYVVITGGSAGGHLASLAALTPHEKAYQPGFEDADTSVEACVSFYGVYDLAGITGREQDDRRTIAMRKGFLARRVFPPGATERDYEDASPLTRITTEAPDFFVLHGQKDTLVPVAQAHAFVARLRQVSSSTITYAELPGAQHAFEVFSSIRSQSAIKAVTRWLEWHRATHVPGR